MRNPPQPMRPHGFVGRLFGFLMERLSAPNYRWVIAELAPRGPRAYLEIGFGTGRLAQTIAKTIKPARLVGLDPSELMLETARGKLKSFANALLLELKCGDDAMLSSIDEPFDAVVAAHSFQFWRDPAATLARIHELLSHSGALVLVLRRRDSNNAASWIPNPISKSSDELGGVRDALAAAGFRIVTDEPLKTGSHGIAAVKA